MILRSAVRSLPNHCGVASTSRTRLRTYADASSNPRVYRYAIDVHGQLFLYDTKPKNLTSCYKNPQFLDFFFTRIRSNESNPADSMATGRLEEDWTETGDFSRDQAFAFAKAQGYHWVSPCQGEQNFIRAADSPIVFRELRDDGTLIWAGSLEVKFEPQSLKVDRETGYVYHPSPHPPLRSLQRELDQGKHPYGAYSLLSSALVMQRLAEGLDLDTSAFQRGKGGSVEWQGKRYDMALLDEKDAHRDRRYRVDDLAE